MAPGFDGHLLSAGLTRTSLSQLVVDQVSDAIFILDAEGSIIEANPAACRMLGYDHDELRALNALDVSSDPNGSKRLADRQTKQKEEGKDPCPERCRLIRKDGTSILVEAINHPLFDGQGTLVGYMAFNRDVTHEQEQTDEIKLLSSIVEQTDSAIAVVKVEAVDARVVYLNQAFERLLDIKSDSLLGQKVPLLRPDTALDDASKAIFKKCREKGVPGRAHSVIKRPDGTERIVEVHLNPIRSSDGQISHWVGLHNDVTEQFERDQRLKIIERSLETLDVGYTITRTDSTSGIVEYANPAWERITGFDRTKAIGMPLPQMIIDDPMNTIDRREVVKAFFEQRSIAGLSKAAREDGSTFIRELEAGPVADASGKPTHWYAITKDVTEQVNQSETIRLLSSAVDQSPVATVIATVAGKDASVSYVNPAWENMFGIPAERALNRPWSDSQIATPVDDDARNTFIAATNQGMSGEGDMTFVDTDGRERFIHVVLNPIKDDQGTITHWVGTCTDVTEQRLKDSRLQVIERTLETMDVGYMTTEETADGPKVDYINPALERMLGMSADQLLGQPPPSLMRTSVVDDSIPKDQQLTPELVDVAARSGSTATGLVKTIRLDGSVFFRRVHLGPVRDDRDNTTHWYSLSTDVTHDLERDQQLRIYKLVFEQSPNPIVVVDDQEHDSRVVFVNKAYCTLLGLDPVGAGDSPVTGQLLKNELNNRNTELAKQARRDGKVANLSFQYAAPDGGTVHLETRMFPITGPNGPTSLWASISVDVSAEVEAKARLELLEQAWDQSPTGMTITTAGDLVIQEVNPAFEAMNQYSSSELVGLNTTEFWKEALNSSEQAGEILEQLTSTGSYQGVIPTRRRDGTEYQRDVLCNPIKDKAGQITHILSMSTDITEVMARQAEIEKLNAELETRVEKRTAQLRSANENLWQTLKNLKETQAKLIEAEKYASLSNLVAGVAHEINTPVGIAVTAASMMSEKLTALRQSYDRGTLSVEELEAFFEHQREADAMLTGNLSRASDLISSFKKVAVDQSTDDIREIELARYLDEVFISLRPQLKKQKIVARITCPDSLRLVTNPGALSQILTNLALNSAIHAYDGSEEGVIDLLASVIDDHQIRLVYRDFGAGMTEEQQNRVFEPFFTTKRGTGGSGLGMNIVYNLVSHSLHGQISVSSASGSGTTFEIVIPQNVADVEPAAPAPLSRSSDS